MNEDKLNETELKVLPYFCPECGCPDSEDNPIARRHQNCMYVEEHLNWQVACLTCFNEKWHMYQDWWDEYYGGLL